MITKEERTILIYTPQITNRLKYIFDFIFAQELGLSYQICTNQSSFEKSELNKFSYSNENIFKEVPFLESHKLLQETAIQEINIDTFIHENYKAFFKTPEPSFFGFDIFAASFYLLSRYEEYLPFNADEHGRFQAEQSLAFKEDFLEIPLINIWINLFKIKLFNLLPDLIFKPQHFRFISTIDIDNAYADLNKGIYRSSFSLIKLLFSFNFNKFIEKIKVLNYSIKDKYDNYDFIEQIHEKYDFKPLYFVLYSRYGKYDKNPSINNKAFKNLIIKLAQKYEIGLHPSYQSNQSIKILREEKSGLENIIKKPITSSRQHFLKLSFPSTYENLIAQGIQQDFSMGYSSMPGFRASVCSAYKFFNLITNNVSDLEIIPFAFMDACFVHYLKLNPEDAFKKIKKIIETLKKVNGLFVSLYHNENLQNTKSQFDWRYVFDLMLFEVKNGHSI